VSRFKWHPVKQKRGFYVRSDQVGYLHRLVPCVLPIGWGLLLAA
jgi:hypothetical protein